MVKIANFSKNMSFWQELQSKNKPILVLAPMAGITDSAFRLLCRENKADVVYTEMVSIDALYYGSKKTLKMLEHYKKEKPVVIQLFGKRPELVAKAVKIVEKYNFDGIDLNFGCPAKKVINHGGGVKLLQDLDTAYNLVKAVCDNTTLPVSVKTRVSIGAGENKVTVFDFIEKIKDLPVAVLMLHGRTFEEGFSGEVHYDILKEVKQKFNGIVIGNGGLNKPEDVKKMIDKTGVDGVGIARGVYGVPYLFAQIKSYLKKGKYKFPSKRKLKKIAYRHAKLNFETLGKTGIIEMRKHLCWYFRGFPNVSNLRSEFVQVETLRDVKKVLRKV